MLVPDLNPQLMTVAGALERERVRPAHPSYVAVVHPRHADLLAAIQRAGGPRRQGHAEPDRSGPRGPLARPPQRLGRLGNLLRRLSHAPDPNRRRAALVLLAKPIHACDDERLRELAVEIVDRQHGDRNPLVTKAVSWLLRSMVIHHRDTVAGYLAANEATLAAIVLRETRTKLATGTKRGRA